jgi:hypothetical protein
MTPHMNQIDAQTPSVLQLILCYMTFYTCDGILFHSVCLQPSLKDFPSQELI